LIEMRAPIVIAEGLDVSFFGSTDAAALALEGPDVIEGIYRAFDADARPLLLRSNGGPTDYSAQVEISLQPGARPDVIGLSTLLREYLGATRQAVPQDAPLAALLDRAVAHAGMTG
jgi:hypothetical protein